MNTATLPFAPPCYSLDDNGSAYWPPDASWITEWPEDWPFRAEAWEKYVDEGERRRIMDKRTEVECDLCHDKFPLRRAKAHARERHHAELLQGKMTLHYSNPLCIWQLLGFEDYWWGKPHGWQTLIDGRTERCRQWEYDVNELGTCVADHFWAERD